MLINYLPPVLQNISDIKVIMSNGDIENKDLSSKIAALEYNQYFLEATEKGTLRYENMLSITSKATETLEERRFKLFSKYNQQLPYTKTVLERQLKTLCSENGYKLMIDYENNTLTVKVLLTAKAMFNTVSEFLENIIPLNLIIDLSLLYNQYSILEKFTYEYLEQYTYEQLREEVMS